MDHKPMIGTKVRLSNGKTGTVSGYPKKPKHSDRVFVAKDGERGCNSVAMPKYRNLEVI